MSEWKEYRLDKCAEIKNGKSRPKNIGIVPVYGGNGILDYCNNSNVSGETIIIGRVGAYCGSVYFENNEIWVSDNALFAKSKPGFDSKYLYYLLTHDNLNQYAGGSSHPLLTQSRLNELKYSIPDLPTQTAIAEILSSLDDKIELNNKINQELENLAQTLFKQWFIDFEFPNENGEPYKSSGGEMVESELGEIPKGWEVSNLNQIARLVKKNIKPFENPDTLYFHYSLPEFDSGKIPSIDLGSTILSSKYEVSEHSILVSKLNPRIPRIWTIINPESNSICSTEFQVLKPTKVVFFPFVNYLCKSEIYLSSLQSKVTGTSSSHQRVNPLDIINYEVVLPQIELIDKFFHSTYDFIQKIEKNIQENIQLTNLRDNLLPKLISGELEVSQVQKSI